MNTGWMTGSGGRKMTVAAVLTLAVGVTLTGTAGARAAAGRAPDAAGIITTIAGGNGGPGPATKVAVTLPRGVSFAAGHLYVSQWCVRKVSEATGWLTTPAGSSCYGTGSLGDGGPAAQAGLGAFSTAVDKAGNLVLGDENHNRVRVVAARTGTFYGQPMTAKDTYTVAGNGNTGYSGDGGPARAAELSGPWTVVVDGHGNLVIADVGNNRVRVVAVKTGTFYGQAMTAGDIYTVAGDGTAGSTGDGGPAASAEIGGPSGLALDGSGNLVLTDSSNTDSGYERVVAVKTGTFYGQAMTAGDIYTVAGGGNDSATSGIPATSAWLYQPAAVAVDGHGNLVIAVSGSNDVRVVAVSTGTFYGHDMTAGDIYTVAGGGTSYPGDGGPATSAGMYSPQSVALDSAGNLLVADTFDSRVRMVAGQSGTYFGEPMTAGDIYTIAGDGTEGSSGDGGPALKAELRPGGLTPDRAGNLVITDTAGLLQVAAHASGTFYGQPMTAGHIYAIAGGGTSYPGDGGPALSGELAHPEGVALDSAGNLLVTEGYGNRVRMVAEQSGSCYGQQVTAGDIYTVAGDGARFFRGDGGPATQAQLDAPGGVAIDGAGNLVITDTYNNRVRVVAASTGTYYGQPMTADDIYTVAGDGRVRYNGNGRPATQAGIYRPGGVAVDGHGNLLVTDANNRIRVVAVSTGTFYGQAMTAGDIYSVVGNGTAGFSGDGGPATQAGLASPAGVTVDEAANLLVTDQGNNRIRVVAASTGTFYGQAMTAGHIYTIAGGGDSGPGDGGPATSAELNAPQDVAVQNGGSLVIADGSRVRKVSG
jgi:hypothetical protein